MLSSLGLQRVRIVVAGAAGSPLTEAAADALARDQRVDVTVLTVPLTVGALDGCDVLLSAGHTHYIGRELRETPRLGAVGLHPSLLPRYRGTHPLWWMLRNGETEAGLTLYHLVKDIDAGPIIDQVRVPIERLDSWGLLYARVCAQIAPMLDRFVTDVLAAGIAEGTPQNEVLATVVHTPRPIGMHLWRMQRKLARALFR